MHQKAPTITNVEYERWNSGNEESAARMYMRRSRLKYEEAWNEIARQSRYRMRQEQAGRAPVIEGGVS